MLLEGVLLAWDCHTYPYIQHLAWPTWYRTERKGGRDKGREEGRPGCITCYREIKDKN